MLLRGDSNYVPSPWGEGGVNTNDPVPVQQSDAVAPAYGRAWLPLRTCGLPIATTQRIRSYRTTAL